MLHHKASGEAMDNASHEVSLRELGLEVVDSLATQIPTLNSIVELVPYFGTSGAESGCCIAVGGFCGITEGMGGLGRLPCNAIRG